MPEQREDGLTVVRKNGVAVSTYYAWQRKVFQAVTAKADECFAEVPVYSVAPSLGSRAAVIRKCSITARLGRRKEIWDNTPKTQETA